VMNILSAIWTLFVVLGTEASGLKGTWEHAVADGAAGCKKDPLGAKCYTGARHNPPPRTPP